MRLNGQSLYVRVSLESYCQCFYSRGIGIKKARSYGVRVICLRVEPPDSDDTIPRTDGIQKRILPLP